MNESLLPTRNVLQETEMLRVVGADGRPLRLPLGALLDAAEARFATNAAEAAARTALWSAVNALAARVAGLEAAPAPAPADLAPLAARVTALEARPVVSTAGLATQAAVNAVASSASTNAADVAALAVRVARLEAEIKLKKDK